jgi:hypothetical protein
MDCASRRPIGRPLRGDLSFPAFSPDGRTLAVPCVGLTLLLDENNRIRRQLIQRNVQHRAAFSRDGKRVAVGAGTWGKDLGAGVRLWDVATGQPLGPFVPTPQGKVEDRDFGPGDRSLRLLTTKDTGDPYRRVTFLHWHDGTTGERLREPLSLGEAGARAFSPDGDRLAIAHGTREVQQWGSETGRRVGPAMPQPDDVRALCYSPDRGLLAVATDDQAVRIWDAASCLAVGPPLIHRAAILGMAFTPDGTRLVTVTSTGFTHTWPAPREVADDVERFRAWLAVGSGLAPDGERLALLDARAWKERREELLRRWPDRDPALHQPLTEGERDEALARDAEETADGRAERTYLQRRIARGRLAIARPPGRLPVARRRPGGFRLRLPPGGEGGGSREARRGGGGLVSAPGGDVGPARVVAAGPVVPGSPGGPLPLSRRRRRLPGTSTAPCEAWQHGPAACRSAQGRRTRRRGAAARADRGARPTGGLGGRG